MPPWTAVRVKVFSKGRPLRIWRKIWAWKPVNWKKTVARYNDLVKAKSDADFGKKAAYMIYPVKSGPFYAFETQVVSLSSIGGVRVNDRLQVTDINAKPVPGLYAVGNVAGGFLQRPLLSAL
ncbi:FAD-binding protein [Acerihabitans sp. KWT182]|uniref:FAD-binding protein n=1 Tax=Acerihabitans sp. KWT182 TaxID=3157919 RepID=A0AAU7QE45_9GAMM